MSATTLEPTDHAPRSSRDQDDRLAWWSAMPFFAMHVAPLGALFVVVTWQDWMLCAVLYVSRMFLVTAGYHRYFSHRSYRMGRVGQFLVATAATTAAQKGPLWWAGHHRVHHRYTDVDGDVHSPRDGFWWSHVGWILSTRNKRTPVDSIRDFAARPELRVVDRWHWIGPWALGGACFAVGGWGALLVGFVLSTVLLWHGTFIVNSLSHLVGHRRYATPDTSRNSMLITLVTGGEGWHNNHHYLPASARQGFAWWEIDPTWWGLRVLALFGIVRDLRHPPRQLLDQARVRDGAFDIGMFRAYWERAAKVAGDRIADLSNRPSLPPADEPPENAREPSAPNDSSSALSGFIHHALEAANQLAASTRRRPGRTPAAGPGSDGPLKPGG